jgi:hypothetical protein
MSVAIAIDGKTLSVAIAKYEQHPEPFSAPGAVHNVKNNLFSNLTNELWTDLTVNVTQYGAFA